MTGDITTLHPRDLIRGLMRGCRSELKLGYSPRNAALAVARLKSHAQRGEEFELLNSYGQGYSDGLRRCQIMASQGDTPCAETDAYCAGYVHGLLEDQKLTYPSSEAV